MKYKFLFAFVFIFLNIFCCFSTSDIPLSGEWKFRIDSLSIGENEHWENDKFSQSITLPGSTDNVGIGNTYPIFKSILGCDRFIDYPKNADFGMLTRKHKYIGRVWYQKEIVISPEEEGFYTLFLERVMWRSKVWVDGIMTGDAIDFLSSPHMHYIGRLEVGKHLITIMVDNSEIYPIGTLGHSYCPHMQTQWNGIVGNIVLNKLHDVNIKNINVYPSFKNKNIHVVIDISKLDSSVNNAQLFLSIKDKQTNEYVYSDNYQVDLSGKDKLLYDIVLNNPKTWDEFEPNLYQLETRLSANNSIDKETIVFGFRDLEVKDKHFTVNGKKIIYRNSHEGMCFPITGYPDMHVDYWKNIWKLYKEHGFNAVRFHSSCPPEAAFIAADELGLYIQVEFFWKDGWMGWKDLIGQKNNKLNKFVYDEVKEALNNYGNHPSMMLVSFGNELGGDFEWMGERLKELKELDPRHLYAAGIAHDITDYDDFVEYGGKNQAQKFVGTNWNYSDNYNVSSAHNYDDKFRRKLLPEFTHETGQYIVHPLWSEIEKYNGVLEPLNLKYYKSLAQKNGIAALDYELQKASGQINKNLYKAEIEATLRTPESAGYSLLSMVDYPGQGEALVGWVDPFYDNKNFMTPEEFVMFGNHTVPLLLFDKYVWEDGEMFSAEIEVANYGRESLKYKKVCYKISADNGKLMDSGNFSVEDIPQGKLSKIGRFNLKLNSGEYGNKIDIEVKISGTSYRNKWSVWVFPKERQPDYSSDIVQTSSLDIAIDELRKGKKVLLVADKLGNRQNRIYSAFNPVFWSATWFTGQDTDVSGAYIRNNHPALSLFPTEDVMDWQWEDICRYSRGFILNNLPKDYYPIVQPVNDFHHGNKLGTVFELKTSEGGKLMVCGYNLTDSLDLRLATRQLKQSLLKYMSSNEFNPKQIVGYDWLRENFKNNESIFEKEKKELNAVLFVAPDDNTEFSRLSKWRKETDNVIVNYGGYDYNIECDGVWQDAKGSYWVGKQLTLEIKVDHPKLMNLKMCFLDSNNSNRFGTIKCEDTPEIELGSHENETWVSVPITRENCLDGIIKVSIKCKSGPNLMLNKFALTLQ